MTTIRPNIGDEHRYNLAQACRLLEISKPTFYKKAAAARISRRPSVSGGRIYYTGLDIKKIWQNG